MNLGQLRALVSGWVDDKDNGYFTTSDVNSYLNQAQREVQKILIQAFEDQWVYCKQTNTFIGQVEYDLPDDFKKLARLELVLQGTTVQTESRRRLSKITRNQQDDVSMNSGSPLFYNFQNNKLILYPCPDQSLTLRMWYIYLVADMTLDADEPDIPEEYHEFLAVLATITCLTRDGRDASTFIEKRKYYETQMKRDAEQRNIDQPRTIVQTEDDGGGGDFSW